MYNLNRIFCLPNTDAKVKVGYFEQIQAAQLKGLKLEFDL